MSFKLLNTEEHPAACSTSRIQMAILMICHPWPDKQQFAMSFTHPMMF